MLQVLQLLMEHPPQLFPLRINPGMQVLQTAVVVQVAQF